MSRVRKIVDTGKWVAGKGWGAAKGTWNFALAWGPTLIQQRYAIGLGYKYLQGEYTGMVDRRKAAQDVRSRNIEIAQLRAEAAKKAKEDKKEAQNTTSHQILTNSTFTGYALNMPPENIKRMSNWLGVPNIRPILRWAYKLGTNPVTLATAVGLSMIALAKRSGVPYSPALKRLLKEGAGAGAREHMRYIGRIMSYYLGIDEELRGLIDEAVFRKLMRVKTPSPQRTKTPTPSKLTIAQSLKISPKKSPIKTPTPKPKTPTPKPKTPTPKPRTPTPKPRTPTPRRVNIGTSPMFAMTMR